MSRVGTRVQIEDDAETATPREAVHQRRGAADRSAAHVEEHDAPRQRTRRRKATVNEDVFFIPLDEIPEGSEYEWKRWSVSGQHDPFYIAQMREQGWEPVNPKRHPNWVPPGYVEPNIIKNGMILMERPKELSEEARREIRQLSRRQVREAEQRLGKSEANELQRTKPTLIKEMMRPVTIED